MHHLSRSSCPPSFWFVTGLDHQAHTPVFATARTPSRSGSARTPFSFWFVWSTNCGKDHWAFSLLPIKPNHWQETASAHLAFHLIVSRLPPTSLVELTEDILKQLMELVFTLVCNGELSLARVLRKNILDKVEQKKLLRYTNSLKPLAARGVSAR